MSTTEERLILALTILDQAHTNRFSAFIDHFHNYHDSKSLEAYHKAERELERAQNNVRILRELYESTKEYPNV